MKDNQPENTKPDTEPEIECKGPTNAEIAFGGSMEDVTFEAEDENTVPVTERVKVRILSLAAVQDKYEPILGQMAKMIDLYCDKPAGWSETLTIESQERIWDRGFDLNYPTLRRYLERSRRLAQVNRGNPLNQSVVKLLTDLASSLQKPPSSSDEAGKES